MANSSQALKRVRQNIKRNRLRASQRSMVATYLKKVLAAIQSKDKEVAMQAFHKAVKVLDRMANKGVIHKNKASRHKSRLSAHIKSMGTS